MLLIAFVDSAQLLNVAKHFAICYMKNDMVQKEN